MLQALTPDDLPRIAEAEHTAAGAFEHTVHVCVAAGCLSQHSDQVQQHLEQSMKERGLAHCRVKGVGCMGLCSAGPLVSVHPEGALYRSVTPEDAPAIVESLGGTPVDRLICPTNRPFFTQQTRVVLANSGEIDPERLEDYIAAGGYQQLAHVLSDLTPGQVVDQVSRSGLRGRGGAGYPTGLKWGTVAKASGPRKFVICNADEGDPGAFMDRSVLESDPHRVLDGMAIAAYAVGTNEGYVYIRAEYPLAIKRLHTAIRQAERAKLLGNGILGTSFSLNLHIRLGAGAFVCGEETALIASIEGKRGQPRPRPPFPAESGLWNAPTLINNVETYANIAPIIEHGPEWFASIDPAQRNIFGMLAQNPELTRGGIRLRSIGQQIIELLGGKRIHPAWVVPGGVSEPLAAEKRSQMLAMLPEAKEITLRALAWLKGTLSQYREEIASFANFPSLFMGLVNDVNELEHYDGYCRIVASDGRVVADRLDPLEYQTFIEEKIEDWTYLKSTFYKPLGETEALTRSIYRHDDSLESLWEADLIEHSANLLRCHFIFA